MKSMNLFESTKPKKKIYAEYFKKKAVNLASKVGVTKAAEELGVSTSSIYSWQKSLAKELPPAPIQDENGNLTFNLEGKEYSLNVNSEEERERVKEEVNSNSLTKYDWFKEKEGNEHWVLYNTEMYEVYPDIKDFLYYKKDSDLAPVIPINATSCCFMFFKCKSLTRLDLNNFNTSNVINMRGMFYYCESLTQLDLSNFNTSQVTNMYEMFSECESLIQLDLSSFDISNVTNMSNMFFYCKALTQLDLSNFDTSNAIDMGAMFFYCEKLTTIYASAAWKTNSVENSNGMFKDCFSLPNYDSDMVDVEMAKPVEHSGYLTLKK